MVVICVLHMNLKPVFVRCFDWAMNIFLSLVVLAVLWFLAQLFCYATFTIPTDSMTPTLIPGDRIIVDKTVMGARLFDFFDALKGKQVRIHRTWGRKDVKSGDILVFNFPYAAMWDSIAMDIRTYFVKRCAATPGDTVEIRDCMYYVNGRYEASLNNDSAKRLADFLRRNSGHPETISQQVVTMAFPNDSTVPWTVSDFGPMVVPGTGTEIQLDSKTATIYRNYIEWETGKKLIFNGDSVYLGDEYRKCYEFDENYYFVVGDNVFNSKDSRYFGLLPEPFVVGKAAMILSSEDKFSGRKRKNRYFKTL